MKLNIKKYLHLFSHNKCFSIIIVPHFISMKYLKIVKLSLKCIQIKMAPWPTKVTNKPYIFLHCLEGFLFLLLEAKITIFFFESNTLRMCNNLSILSISLASVFSWNEHGKIRSKENSLLIQIQAFLTLLQLLTLYKTQIHPCLKYGKHLWGGISKHSLATLDAIQPSRLAAYRICVFSTFSTITACALMSWS